MPDACFVIMVSSMIPQRSLRDTDNVDVYGARVENHEGTLLGLGATKSDTITALLR